MKVKLSFILFILVVFALTAPQMCAQEYDPLAPMNRDSLTGYEYIIDVAVTGNINVSPKLIESASGLAPGDIYTPESISSAIKNIYKLGLFERINVNKIVPIHPSSPLNRDYGERAYRDEKGAKIIIKVVEYPIIQEVVVTGNKKIKTEDINTEMNLVAGDYWSDQKKFETRNHILSLYNEKGYRLATVHFEEQQMPVNKIKLTILIDEGQKVAVEAINFSGNLQIPDKKLRKVMKTKVNGLFHSGEFKQEKFEEDLQRIEEFYHAKGFIDATVLDWGSEYDEDGNLIIKIEFYEGNQYKIGTVSVEGNSRFSDEDILSQLKIKQGEIFNQEEFNEKLNAIHSMYYEEGYIYSSIKQDIQRAGSGLRLKGECINVVVKISENTRARVRQIFINGNTQTKEKVIRRQLAIVPGDYFRQSLLMQSQRNIYNLGFFEQDIGLDYQPINDDGDIDLIFTVKDKTSGSANAGVSFDQQDKLVGFIGVSHNNLFGNAWRTGVQWEFSGIKQNYNISFTNPFLFDTNTLIGFEIYHTKRSWTDWNYKVYRTGGGVRLGTMIPWVDYSRVTCGYSLTEKKYEIIEPDTEPSSELKELVAQGSKLTSLLSLTLQRDGRDNVFRASEGSIIKSLTELAGGPLGGSENYYKEILQTNWYLKLFWKAAMGVKCRLGYVKEFGESDKVPPDERFYPGGIGPDGIRGYSESSVVPSLEGGNSELICSSEITFPISGDQLFGIIFFDAGNSYSYLSEMNIHGLKKGAGVGVRIMTPMGLIGFDYAYGFDKAAKNKWQTHFQFGTTF